MPNGGMLPCCFICKWAIRDEQNLSLINPVACQKHGFAVWMPTRHFCAKLTDTSGAVHSFVKTRSIDSSDVYAWIELQYRTAEYPDLPQYYHEFLPIASLETYTAWSEAEKQAAYRRLYEVKQKEFAQKYGQLEE
jgi:hypothetical protein